MFVPVEDGPRDFHLISDHAFRLETHCFAPDGGQVGGKNGVSIDDVIWSDRAVFEQVMTYHSS